MSLKLSILCLVLLVEIISATRNHSRNHSDHKSDKNWKDHASKHNLTFLSDDHESDAFENYQETDDLINLHNKGNHTFKLGHNHFSHLNESSRNKTRGHMSLIHKTLDSKRSMDSGFTIRDGFIWTPMQGPSFGGFNGYIYNPTPKYVAPASVNWIQRGFNKPVKNQGQCGDCYAFASVASIEGSLFSINKTTVTLSPEQITDCSMTAPYKNNGCNGGNAGNTFFYAAKNGVCAESLYPFVSGLNAPYTPAPCTVNKCNGGTLYKVKHFYLAQTGSDAAVMEMLDTLGPLYVAVDASGLFGSYSSGVYASKSGTCSTSTNHAVLLVGYGTDKTTNLPIWTIKNQWNTWWGVGGYMNISRAIPNNCGISTQASFPFL